jgi:SOS-response transcriptional repressor LexA
MTTTARTTTRQQQVVDAILEARARHPSYGPSFREIAMAIGTSVNDVAEKCRRLKRDGVIAWEPGIARSLRVGP